MIDIAKGRNIFQFYLVRLMVPKDGTNRRQKEFQFYLVRLMAVIAEGTTAANAISILPSTINGYLPAVS